MAKQFPKLTLINNGESPEAENQRLSLAQGFDYATLNDLGPSETKRIERLLHSASPKAGVIAVARTQRLWDLRPVVMRVDEDGPSIIRLAGPDVVLNASASVRLREHYERVARFKSSSAQLRDWGLFEDQLWFRRTLVPETLAHLLSGPEMRLCADEALSLIALLASELSDWHAHGIIHGHLTTSNICLGQMGQRQIGQRSDVYFLDSAVSAMLALCDKETPEALKQTLAPEILQGESPVYASDVFGLGQVIRRIFVSLRKKYQFADERSAVEAKMQEYVGICKAMIETSPEERPSLGEVCSFFRSLEQKKNRPQSAGKVRAKHPSGIQGRIVKPGSSGIFSGISESENTVQEQGPDLSFSLEEDEEFAKSKHGQEAGFAASNELQKSDIAQKNSFEAAKTNSASENSIWLYCFFFVVALVGIWYYFRGVENDAEVYTVQELSLKWESGLASKMRTVAELALESPEESNYAEEIIVRSAKNGSQLEGVDVGLLRIAFNSKWEAELAPEDRRTALALALAKLLKNFPQDLGSLQDRHPGILLAITASAGQNASRILQDIPAARLASLPPPFKQAFLKLLSSGDKASCAHPEVKQLARFGTRGIEDTGEVGDFLGSAFQTRLGALALLYAADNTLSRRLLDVLLNHPNFNIERPELVWAKSWALTEWSELEPADQLFVLAGIPPVGKVHLKHLGTLFAHPSAEVRSYAIEQALERIKFQHPGTYGAFRLLRAQPSLLTADQLFKLAELLENPDGASKEKIRAWLASEPAPPGELISILLAGGHEAEQATKIDPWLTMYLRVKGWQPDVKTLRNLSGHPDGYTRLFAYNMIFKMKDSLAAKTFLKSALSEEQNPVYREQLEAMIRELP